MSMSGISATRETVSGVMISRLESIANRVSDLRDRVYVKLEPIMAPDSPANGNDGKEPAEESYSTYFSQMRSLCKRIEENVLSIESALNRTEF